MEAAKAEPRDGGAGRGRGFHLAPRLNAAGRLGCARLVVDLLTTADPQRAKEIAEYLDEQNVHRQTLERKISQQAREMVDAADVANAAGHRARPRRLAPAG